MRNTQENFPEVPVTELSNWQVVDRSNGETFDVTSTLLSEGFTEVTFTRGEVETVVRFTPGVGEQLSNGDYAVVFKYGGDPVIDSNGTQN